MYARTHTRLNMQPKNLKSHNSSDGNDEHIEQYTYMYNLMMELTVAFHSNLLMFIFLYFCILWSQNTEQHTVKWTQKAPFCNDRDMETETLLFGWLVGLWLVDSPVDCCFFLCYNTAPFCCCSFVCLFAKRTYTDSKTGNWSCAHTTIHGDTHTMDIMLTDRWSLISCHIWQCNKPSTQ